GANINQGVGTSTRVVDKRETKNTIANLTLVSMYTIFVYLFGVVTSVFLVENGQGNINNYNRFLALDTLQGLNADMNGGGKPKFVEIIAMWIQNLLWQPDPGYMPS